MIASVPELCILFTYDFKNGALITEVDRQVQSQIRWIKSLRHG